jgi:arylsulfatase A-like enzyme
MHGQPEAPAGDAGRRAGQVAWAFGLACLTLGGADVMALASLSFLDGEQAEAMLFLPRLLLGLPLMVSCTAWLACRLRQVADARLGRAGASIVDLACALPLLVCVADLFSGPAISVSPWRWPLLAALSACVLGGLLALRALAVRVSRLPRNAASARRLAVAACACCAALVAAGAWLTSRTFHNLYPAFHQAIAFALVAACAACLHAGLAAQTTARRFRISLTVALLALVWMGSAVLTWHAAGGRRVLAETAPFAGAFVPQMFRLDAALLGRLRARDVAPTRNGAGGSRPALASVPFGDEAARSSFLLITIDALRADALEPGSRYAPATPGLRRLAEQSMRFERAYASSNRTSLSLPPLLSGVVNGTGRMDAAYFLPTALAAAGYDTLAWVTSNNLRADDSAELRAAGYHCRASSTQYRGAAEVTAWARAALGGQHPVFVWIHLSDVHSPYWLPKQPVPKGRKLVNEYAERLAVVDEAVTALIEHAQTHSRLIWALSADHGEAFGEHGTHGHASTLYDEQLRVPLLIGGSGVTAGRVSQAVSTIDLAATLMHLAGARLPASVTILPPWAAQRASVHGARSAPVLSYAGDTCAFVAGDHKLIADTYSQTLALFDLASDPGELRSVLHQQPALALQLLRGMRDAGCAADLRLLEAAITR